MLKDSIAGNLLYPDDWKLIQASVEELDSFYLDSKSFGKKYGDLISHLILTRCAS